VLSASLDAALSVTAESGASSLNLDSGDLRGEAGVVGVPGEEPLRVEEGARLRCEEVGVIAGGAGVAGAKLAMG
jgi:hypothetical protein